MTHYLSPLASTLPIRKKRRQRQIETALPPNRHIETAPSSDQSDWIWHGEKIAQFPGISPEKLYYLFSQGMFSDAIWKMGRKTMVASRSRLRELPTLLSRKTP